MLQGANFLSHVLWSGIVCWLVIFLLYLVILEGSSPARRDVAG